MGLPRHRNTSEDLRADDTPHDPWRSWPSFAAPAWSGELRVGAAAVTITPPVGTPMAGYYSERGAQGVHDDLLAKAIVIEVGGRVGGPGRARPDHHAPRPRRGGSPRDRADDPRARRRRHDQRHAHPHRPGPRSQQCLRRPVRAGARLPRRPAGEDRRGRATGRGSARACQGPAPHAAARSRSRSTADTT